MKFCIKILPLLFLAISQKIHALDIDITSKSVESYIQIEDNKNFDFFGDISVISELELNNMYTIRSGVSLGRLDGNIDLKSFASASVFPFIKIPLGLSLLWNYNGLFEYDVHSHAVVPIATYNWKRIGLSLGYNFRFTSFFNEEHIMEAIPVISLYFNIINNENLRFTFIWGNYNEFGARNLPDYSNNFTLCVRVNDSMQLISIIELLQSGAFSFVESLYGVSFKMGMRYSW